MAEKAEKAKTAAKRTPRQSNPTKAKVDQTTQPKEITVMPETPAFENDTKPSELEGWTMNYDKMMTAGNENVEAVMSASKIAAEGFEKLNQEMMAFAKIQMDESAAISRDVMGCKDIKEFFDMQSNMSRKFFDTWMAESTKITELSMKTMTDAMAPLTERVNATVESVTKAAS